MQGITQGHGGLTGNIIDDLYTSIGGGKGLLGLVIGADLLVGAGEMVGAAMGVGESVFEGLGETFSGPVG